MPEKTIRVEKWQVWYVLTSLCQLRAESASWAIFLPPAILEYFTLAFYQILFCSFYPVLLQYLSLHSSNSLTA